MRGEGILRGRLVRCLLAVAIGGLIFGAAAGAAVADEAQWFFDPSKVYEIDFDGLSTEELAAIEAEPDEYQPGTMTVKVGGYPVGPTLDDVGIRLKGGLGSFRPLSEKAAFKVKVNEYSKQTFYGLKKLTFNNMVQDPSMLHETLTYELFRELGVWAPRTGFAFIRVNGEPYGVYLNVETYDKVSLPLRFASTQHLYEADAPGLDLVPDEGSDIPTKAEEFEVDEGDDEDLADLEALIAAASAEGGDWSDGMAGIADLDEMTRMWAVERYVGHWDGYAGVAAPYRPNNYYVHSDDAGLFSMLPWGTDQTWGLPVEFDEQAGGLLFNRCLEDASCEIEYRGALSEVQEAVPDFHFGQQAAELAQLLAPCQALEAAPHREYDGEEIAEGVADLQDFIAARPGELATFLGNEAPAEDGEAPPLNGSEPCSPRPEPEPESEPAPPLPPAVTPTPPAELLVAHPRRRGNRVLTPLRLPAGGTVVQTVSARFGRRRHRVCVGRVKRGTAGKAVVGCKLSRGARRQLRAGSLTLRITVRYRHAGRARTFVRTLHLARRS